MVLHVGLRGVANGNYSAGLMACYRGYQPHATVLDNEFRYKQTCTLCFSWWFFL